MLKASYDNEADIPADLKGYYRQGGDGKWHLQVEGLVPRARLDEFRDNNVNLQKELDQLKSTFKDVDAAKYKELAQIESDLRSGKLKDGKTVDQILEERTAQMRKELETKAQELAQQNERLNGELSTLRINDAVLRAATAKGLRETAADDIIARAKSVFRLVDGKAKAFDGDKPKYNQRAEEYGIEDFVEDQLKTATHLFKDSDGTGAANAGKGGTGSGAGAKGGLNPWKKESRNLTEQGRILKTDRALAERLAREAGVTLPPARSMART